MKAVPIKAPGGASFIMDAEGGGRRRGSPVCGGKKKVLKKIKEFLQA